MSSRSIVDFKALMISSAIDSMFLTKPVPPQAGQGSCETTWKLGLTFCRAISIVQKSDSGRITIWDRSRRDSSRVTCSRSRRWRSRFMSM